MPLLSRIGQFLHYIAEYARKIGMSVKEYYEVAGRFYPEYREEEAKISYESWTQEEKLRRVWREWHDLMPFTDEVIPEAPFKLDTEYMVTTKLYLYDPNADIMVERRMTFGFDQPFSKANILDNILERLSEIIHSPPELVDWTIEVMYRRPKGGR